MEHFEREFYTNRILSGTTYYYVENVRYFLKSPTAQHKYFSDVIFKETYEKARANGSYDDKEFEDFLISKALWSNEENDRMKALEEDVDKLKVFLYENFQNKEKAGVFRKTLKEVRKVWGELVMKRGNMAHVTCKGVAFAAKYKYLIGSSLYYSDGNPYWQSLDDWEKPDNILDSVLNNVKHNDVTDEQIRELSRTDPWRSVWMVRASCGNRIWNLPAESLSSEQNRIILYSMMYDNIYEHPDKPSDEIINDDDALDGWKLLQKKKREREDSQKSVEEKMNKKIAEADEVFIMATSNEDIQRINDLNDDQAKFAKARKAQQLKQQKKVEEQDFLDSQLKISQQLLKMPKE